MPGEHNDAEKLAVLLGYWIEHNREHIAENRTWVEKAEKAGLAGAAGRLKKVVELSEEANHHMEHAREDVEEALGGAAHAHPDRRPEAHGRGGHAHKTARPDGHAHGAEHREVHAHGAEHREVHAHGAALPGGHLRVHRHIELHQIGEIRTPAREAGTPAEAGGTGTGTGFYGIHLNEELLGDLERIRGCSRVYVLYHRGVSKKQAGRPEGSGWSPERLGQVGMSAVGVLGVSGGVLRTSPIDVPDGTPVLAVLPCLEGGG
jgi:tRNA (Thr-GGU) A37 N-methylase